jgi:hypothetical protein
VIDHATPSPLEGGHQWREGGIREDYGKLVEELTMLAELSFRFVRTATDHRRGEEGEGWREFDR